MQPRLVPVKDAVTMITSGKPILANRANEIGLLDAVCHGDLRDAALDFARTVMDRPRPIELLRQSPVDVPNDEQWEEIEATVRKKARGQIAPMIAVQAIRCGIEQGTSEGLAHEREKFVVLRDSDQSKALRHHSEIWPDGCPL